MKCQSIFYLYFLTLTIARLTASERFISPVSPRETFNFNPGWKFIREDVTNAEQVAYDDSKWSDVSAPHTYNDVDSYNVIISHGGGDRGAWSGITWYRKHFKLPASAKDGKVFLEFEGLKQAGRFWVNGKFVGKYENGITPLGLDLTGFVNFDGDNVIAVKVDNSSDYKEEATGTTYQWMTRDFDPNYGGLNHDIWLHLTGKIYLTLPLYENLQTSGTYIYPSDFSISNKTCDVNIESQVRNESGDQQSITLSAFVVDTDGNVAAKFSSETENFKANGILTNANFWSDEAPHLYDVYCTLTVNDKVVDVQKIKTGFRKTEFKGGGGTGGIYINDKFGWLTGYSQRSSDDWAGLGEAYPDWMHDYNAQLVRDSHANYIRWMHISPQAVDVRACDKTGLIEVCPAGDKEQDPMIPLAGRAPEPRQWDQRVAVMRDSLIYFRNNPSILFWEAGGTVITADHMRQMVALRKQWDPNGGRVTGSRGNDRVDLNTAVTPIAEYYGVMMAQDPRSDALKNPADMFRAYSIERRDRAPFIETEDFREEAARRFWDDYSPPFFGFKPGPNDTWHLNSETFCLAAAARYHDYFSNIITNTDPAHSKWSAYASIYWSDSNADGRQDSSEVARVSGKVDSVRLPKQAYYVYRVMQNPAPDIHIIGHWNYPTNTTKTIYVAANHCDSVKLYVNGKFLGGTNKLFQFVDSFDGKNYGDTGCIFEFPEIKFETGNISAVAIVGGKTIAHDEIQTAGEAKALKLTSHISPNGLQADGSDAAFFDVEVVDAQGRRCPTDEARVDFKLEGPAIWRGGYNSGKTNSVNNLWLDTECGINRVAIRSTLTAGKIILTATRAGLEPTKVEIESKPVAITSGLISYYGLK